MKDQAIISLLCCLLLFGTGGSTSHQGNTYDIMTYGAKGEDVYKRQVNVFPFSKRMLIRGKRKDIHHISPQRQQKKYIYPVSKTKRKRI